MNRIFYFLAGAGIGAATALLSAPQAGKHLRSQIRRKAKYVERSSRELREQAVDLARKGVEATADQGNRIASALREGKRTLAKVVNA